MVVLATVTVSAPSRPVPSPKVSVSAEARAGRIATANTAGPISDSLLRAVIVWSPTG